MKNDSSSDQKSFLLDKREFIDGKSENERILLSILGIVAVGVQIALVIMLMKLLGSFSI